MGKKFKLCKLIRNTVSIFTAVCVALQSLPCYAGGRRKKPAAKKSTHSRRSPTGPILLTSLDINETGELMRKGVHNSLKNARSSINKLAKEYNPAVEPKVRIPEILKRERIRDLDDVNYVFRTFAKMLCDYLNSNGSEECVYFLTTWFMNLVEWFQSADDEVSPDAEQLKLTSDGAVTLSESERKGIYWMFALLTLDICTRDNEGMYNLWYKLLEPHAPKCFGDLKNKFDQKTDRRIPSLRQQFHDISEMKTEDNKIERAAVLIGANLFLEFFGFYEIGLIFVEKMQVWGCPLMSAASDMRRLMSHASDMRCPTESLLAAQNGIAKFKRLLKQSEQSHRSVACFGLDHSGNLRFEQLQAEVDRNSSEIEQRLRRRSDLVSLMLDIHAGVMAVDKLIDVNQTCSPQFNDAVENIVKNYFCCKALIEEYKDEFSDKDIEFLDAVDDYIKWYVDLPVLRQRLKALNEYVDKLLKIGSSEDDAFAYSKDLCDECEGLLEKCKKSLVESDAKEIEDLISEKRTLIAKLEAGKASEQQIREILSEHQKRSEDWKNHVWQMRKAKMLEEYMSSEEPEGAEKEKTHDIVFLHNPDVSDPMKFLNNNLQYKKEWDNWYKHAREGRFLGKPMRWNPSIPIYRLEEGLDLDIRLSKDAHPEIFKYKVTSGEQMGLRIVYYVENTSGRVVILYVGLPFGKSHKNVWRTLDITSKWRYTAVTSDGEVAVFDDESDKSAFAQAAVK